MGVCFSYNGKIKCKNGNKNKDKGNLEEDKKLIIKNDLEGNKDNGTENGNNSNVIVKQEKEKVKNKLEDINNDIKERIDYCNKIKLNLKNFKSEINKDNDIDNNEDMN